MYNNHVICNEARFVGRLREDIRELSKKQSGGPGSTTSLFTSHLACYVSCWEVEHHVTNPGPSSPVHGACEFGQATCLFHFSCKWGHYCSSQLQRTFVKVIKAKILAQSFTERTCAEKAVNDYYHGHFGKPRLDDMIEILFCL